MARKTVVYAAASCTVAHNGTPLTLNQGDPWDSDSPVVKAYPSLFITEHDRVRAGDRGEIVAVDDAPVERATRAPGEKRHRVTR